MSLIANTVSLYNLLRGNCAHVHTQLHSCSAVAQLQCRKTHELVCAFSMPGLDLSGRSVGKEPQCKLCLIYQIFACQQ